MGRTQKAGSSHINRGLVSYIKFLLNYPKLFIIVSLFAVFMIGYSVDYDFTMMKVNLFINNQHYKSYSPVGDFPTNVIGYKNGFRSDYGYKQVNSMLNSNLKGFKITKLTFDDGNVLTYDFLKSLNDSVINYLQSSYGPTIVISPLYDWKFDLSRMLPDDYITSMVNYHSTYLLDSLYLGDISITNQLISSAGHLNVFLVHNKTEVIDPSSWDLNVSKLVEITNTNSVRDFLNYYLLLNKSGITKYLNNFLNFWVILGFSLLLFHLYLSIANLHKLHSNVGILFGWIMEMFIAAGASLNVVRWLSGDSIWEQVLQPSSFFTKSIALMTMMFISSRNLIRIIQELSDCRKSYDTSEDSRLFQTRLYKFYVGMSNSNEARYDKLDFVHKLIRTFKADFDCGIKLPKVSKILALDFLSFSFVEILSALVVNYYFKGEFATMLVIKMRRFFTIIFVSLIIDHLLQLTFLIGVILIDNYRVDVSKILDDDLSVNKNDVNYISYCFLKTKPPAASLRHRIGTNLTFVRLSTSFKSWVIALPVIHLFNCFVLLTTWSIFTPYNLFHEGNVIVKLDITSITFDSFYYLEFFLIVLFYVALIVIVFQLSDYKINMDDSNAIELNDAKVFKSIDLNNSHYLDVVRLKSNNSSFLISVGLDHKVLIWSPLSAPQPQFPNHTQAQRHLSSATSQSASNANGPINVSSTIQLNKKDIEFWPINYVNISSDGEFIILVNYRYNLIKCYSRTLLKFIWTSIIDEEIKFSSDKILESFFREKTVPGFLKMKQMKKLRRNSDVSLNGNYPRLDDPTQSKLDFVMVLETGKILTYSCNDGTLKSSSDVLEDVYDEEIPRDLIPRFISVKKLITPRVNDRIICQVNNNDLIVGIVVNNKWKCSIMDINEENYNKGFVFDTIQTNVAQAHPHPSGMAVSRSNTYQETHSFQTANTNFMKAQPLANTMSPVQSTNSSFEVNKPVVVTIEFVGMIIRVNNLVAELIDVQTGIVLHKVNVGHFKPSSFKVTHSEPTHCTFCGCVSLKSLSIVYEDYDTNTLIVHTFKVESNRSKPNICLRVERDPREIRCAGFSNVIEEQHWFDNISKWEVTDINMIIGIKNTLVKEPPKSSGSDTDRSDSSDQEMSTGFASNRLSSLKKRTPSRVAAKKNTTETAKWEGFIVSLYDGNMTYYDIPSLSTSLVSNRINCIEKFGFKSVAVAFGNSIKILYLGNDKLIENNLYFNDLNKNKAINNELLFINKRRKK